VARIAVVRIFCACFVLCWSTVVTLTCSAKGSVGAGVDVRSACFSLCAGAAVIPLMLTLL